MLFYKIKFSRYLLKLIYLLIFLLLSLLLNLTDIYCSYNLFTYNLTVKLRLVSSLIFVEFYLIKRNAPPRWKSIFYCDFDSVSADSGWSSW